MWLLAFSFLKLIFPPNGIIKKPLFRRLDFHAPKQNTGPYGGFEIAISNRRFLFKK